MALYVVHIQTTELYLLICNQQLTFASHEYRIH